MKKFIVFLFLLSLVYACQKDEVKTSVVNETQDKMALLESAGIVPLKSAVPVVYTDLCPGEEMENSAPKHSISDPAMWNYYLFYGLEGQTAHIAVNRVDCEMDPAFYLYFGTATTTDEVLGLEFVAFRDDEIYPIPGCENACFAWGDPDPDVVLPHTGWYTLGVFDYASCDVIDPLSYTISISGIPPCTIVIDGCDTEVPNEMVGDQTMQELLDEISDQEFKNHGQYVKLVAQLVESWYLADLITLEEKDAIVACAAQSSYGVKK